MSRTSKRHCLFRSPSRLPATLLVLAVCATLSSCAEQATNPPSGQSVSFGQRQVDQLLADRPDMANVLPADHPVMLWVIAGFNGERTGERVYWNAMSPKSGQPSEHWPAYFDYPPQICISGGSETTPIDRWTGLIYEFFNMGNDASFEALGTQAQAGEIDGDAYAEGCAKLEFAALKRAGRFFDQYPLPPSTHGKDPYYRWVQTSPATVEEYFDLLEGVGGYNPIKFYRAHYDESIAPLISNQNGAAGKAAEVATEEPTQGK